MNNIEIQLDPKDFKDLDSLPLQTEGNFVWINTVFNINREGILPARFLRGFLPAFKLAENIRRKTDGLIDPIIRIFQPRNFSMLIDGIEQDIADQQQVLALSTVLGMAKKHFPLTRVKFETDQKVNSKTESILLDIASLIDISQNRELIERLKLSGRRWGGESGEEKSLIYAAHHPFGWSDLHHEAFFESLPPSVVVNALPPSEKKFSLIRRHILEVIEGTDLVKLVRPGATFDRTLNICGAHYIPIIDDLGRRLEPDLRSSWRVTCGDILAQIQGELNSLRSGSLKSNLKKAVFDLQTLIEDLSIERFEDAKDVLFCELIGGEK